MKIAITGARGFLGWHLHCALLAGGRHQVVTVGRDELKDATSLRLALNGCEAVVHLAGVNRGLEAEVEEGNRHLADVLATALRQTDVRVLVFGNSIHSGTDSAFGRSKAYASEHLARACLSAGVAFTDVLLPNVFGEGGRPRYNSFVATFCAELLEGREPVVMEDRQLDLLAAQDAADVLVTAVERGDITQVRPRGHDTSVGTVLEILRGMADYPHTGEFPDLSTRFRVALFNAFQSFCFPERFPLDRAVHSDARGSLFEGARAAATDTLSFVSTTHPGAVRGQHFHRRKVERFLVVEGEAEIRLRKVASAGDVAFRVSGRRPQAVDMPPLWAHAIKNVGTSPLLTVFWTNELLNPAEPDTYRYGIYQEEGTAA